MLYHRQLSSTFEANARTARTKDRRVESNMPASVSVLQSSHQYVVMELRAFDVSFVPKTSIMQSTW